MLEALRRGTGTIIAKIFIGLLAASFAVWGISDVFTGQQTGALATVGDQQVSQQQFQTSFRNRLNAMSRQLGRNLTLQQARQFGLDRQVLTELVNQAALDDQIKKLNLAASDDTIASDIFKNPLFLGTDGKFNPLRFQQLLQSNGFTEPTYIAVERRNKLRAQLAGAIEGAVAVPKVLLKAFHRQANETRVAEYFIVPEINISTVAEPTDKEIKTYYDANKVRFTAPQYRSITLLKLEPKAVAATSITISDEDLRKAYNEQVRDFTTAETRVIEQITFPTKAAAETARARIIAGLDFLALAKERGMTAKDAKLGTLKLADMPDPKTAKAAFALKENEISQPVQGALSIALLRVTKINPEVKKSFEDVKAGLHKKLALDKAKEKVLNLHDTVEDERAGGATLKEIASKLKLPLIEIAAIDTRGNGLDGKPVKSIGTTATKLLPAAFQSDVGVESDPIDTSGEGFIWYDIKKIIPSALTPLAKVRTKAIDLWKKNKRLELLVSKAHGLMEAVRKGADLKAQAKTISQTILTTKAVKRTETDGNFAAQAVASLFRTPRSGVSQVAAKGGGMIVFQVKDVTVPPFITSAKESANLKTQLNRHISQDLVLQYLAGIKASAGVSVNPAIWRRLQGAGS